MEISKQDFFWFRVYFLTKFAEGNFKQARYLLCTSLISDYSLMPHLLSSAAGYLHAGCWVAGLHLLSAGHPVPLPQRELGGGPPRVRLHLAGHLALRPLDVGVCTGPGRVLPPPAQEFPRGPARRCTSPPGAFPQNFFYENLF